MMSIFNIVMSYLVALMRVPFLTLLFVVSCIHQILFCKCEIVNVEMKIAPLRCDRQKALDNVAYLDKLCYENPDLVEEMTDDDNFNDDLGEEDD